MRRSPGQGDSKARGDGVAQLKRAERIERPCCEVAGCGGRRGACNVLHHLLQARAHFLQHFKKLTHLGFAKHCT